MKTWMIGLMILMASVNANLAFAQPVPDDEVLVVFTVDAGCLPDDATSGGVFVMGDFNNWTPCDPNAELFYSPLTGNKLFVGGLSFEASSDGVVHTYRYTRLDAAGTCVAESPTRSFILYDDFPQHNLPPDQWNNEYCCEPSGPDEISGAGSYCVHLCLCGNVLSIPINSAFNPPILETVTFASGCNFDIDGCFENCEAGTGAVEWGTRVDANGHWFMDICVSAAPGALEGCFCMTIDNILPVEFGSFSAISGDGSVRLNWNTLSENNISRFDLERDGNLIAQIPGQGNSAGGFHYSYTDNNVANGTAYVYRLFDVNVNGDRHELAAANGTPSANIVYEYKLFGNYPNPFNPSTSIRYSLANAEHVNLTVFDINGRFIRELVSGTQSSGLHDITFDAAALPSGIYFYRLSTENFTDAAKMVLLK